jgi:hypothetical protein
MDTILRKPEVTRFNISDHLEFHVQSCKTCEKYDYITTKLPLINGYRAAIKQEELVYKWVRKSEFTAKKAEADQARDRAVRSIITIVRTNMNHFDPATREHAERLNLLLETYGNLTKSDYDGETADIDSLLARLKTTAYSPSVLVLGLTEWVVELNTRNDMFKGLVDNAAREQVDKPDIMPRDARDATDEALRAITSYVTALVVLNGPAGYADFVEEFNTLVNHYNTLVHEHYGRLHARVDIAPALIDPIDVQPFTGKPVFVIPDVTLVVKEKDGTEKTVVLEFTKDFTVGYENNVDAGTATLHITGIGKYAGVLTTTFNIERS